MMFHSQKLVVSPLFYTEATGETGQLLWDTHHIHPVEEVEKEAPKWGLELLSVQEWIPKDPKLVGAMRGN